jgi:8-demethyl-8-(2-methoxy-alpha-L-rhamnosyl)tetracenomycin-C 3'-O-methyltransferase
MQLSELALKFGTDKGPSDHDYTLHYEKFLDPLRHSAINLLELGVWEGASLRMWDEYLTHPHANVVGVDRVNRGISIDGVDIHIFEQDSHEDIEFCLAPYFPFDVIIDDASHISSKTIRSFELLWPHLKHGGLYVIEDLQTSYDPKHYGHDQASSDPELAPRNFGARYTAMQFCKRLADEVHPDLFPEKYRWNYDVASVHFHPNICFIVKA